MTNELLKNDEFRFSMPIEIKKAEETKPINTKRMIHGIASTEDEDLQGEVVVQSGLDFSYFLAHGFLNSDHQSGPHNKVGEPTEARITKAGLWISGFLYKGQEEADRWWNLMKAFEESRAKRCVSFSIEGKVIRRAGNRIVKAFIKDIAVTASPVNTHSWAEISKALCAEQWCAHPWKSLARSCPGCPGNLSCPASNKNDDDEENEEKALSAAGMGRTLIPQSLEGGVKTTTYKSLPDHLTKSDAIDYLQTQKGYSPVTARAVANVIFQKKERPHSGGRNEHDC